jgi:hypothetical protein
LGGLGFDDVWWFFLASFDMCPSKVPFTPQSAELGDKRVSSKPHARVRQYVNPLTRGKRKMLTHKETLTRMYKKKFSPLEIGFL